MPQVGPTIGQFLRECFREEAKGLTVDEAVANVLPRYCGTKPVDEPEEKTDMANGVNSVTLIGNLGKDPEVRYSDKGTAICNMRIAITEREKRGDTYEDVTEWVDVVCFGKTAENCGQYLEKGRQIYVNGKMQTRSYEKDGQKRYVTEVKAYRVNFLGGGNEKRERRDNGPARGNELQRSTPQNQGFSDDRYGDDLPF